MTSGTELQLSPVSVLDSSFYKDEGVGASSQWKSPQQRKSFFDSKDFFPEPKQLVSMYGEIKKRLKMRGIDEPSEDLETLRQILEALQLKGLLHSQKPSHQINHRNCATDEATAPSATVAAPSSFFPPLLLPYSPSSSTPHWDAAGLCGRGSGLQEPKFYVLIMFMSIAISPETISETPVRFGILGCATIARMLSRAIRLAPNASISAIGSRSIDKASKFASENGFPASAKVYGSYEAVLDDPEVDAVYVPLPTSLHLKWAVLAAEKKKHLLLEKPVALDVKELDTILEACESNGVQFMDATMWMHHPRTAKMKEFLSDPLRFGQLKSIHSIFTFDAGPDFLNNNIRVKPELGALGDAGCPFSLLNPSETDEQRGDDLDDRGDERRGLSRFPSEVRRDGDRRTERGGERLSRFPHFLVDAMQQLYGVDNGDDVSFRDGS
ncbi:hypothetical protein TEA_027096 [Camellia sinensis var. sinensis]|uniref:Gfo/Idh/MocA-like oxidoreductase N-terminal domain-containing protein n=1 Tax=Camellia sinensis var. sinensis TaxID=542762 RepID=A0A4S4D3V4_CAMSN|nr:hypothetical protein TEA_027096 [Camellia sinensis var. sinensis]